MLFDRTGTKNRDRFILEGKSVDPDTEHIFSTYTDSTLKCLVDTAPIVQGKFPSMGYVSGPALNAVQCLRQFRFFVSAQRYPSSRDFNVFTIEPFDLFQVHDIGVVDP